MKVTQEELQRLAGQLADCSSPRVEAPPYLEAPLQTRKATDLKRPVRLCRVRKESSSASETRRRTGEANAALELWLATPKCIWVAAEHVSLLCHAMSHLLVTHVDTHTTHLSESHDSM